MSNPPRGTGRVHYVHLEAVAVVLVEPLQTLDQEESRGQPDRTAPVRVAAKHAAERVAGPVVDTELFAVDLRRPRVVLVPQREPGDAEE